MSRINTVLDIVNEARRRVKLAPIPADQLAEFESTYYLTLQDLLEQKPWIFAIDRATTFTTTTDGPDLGYNFKYILPSDTVRVVDVDLSESFVNSLSVEDGLRYGYSLDHPTDRALSYEGTNRFIFSDGILHTDREPRAIFYQRTITPDRMPAAFQRLLVLSLAIEFERDMNGDPNLIATLEREQRKQYVKADRIQRQRPSDPYLRGIFDWIRQFYASVRTRY